MNITFAKFAEILENAYLTDGRKDRKITMIKTLREKFIDLSLLHGKKLTEWYIDYRMRNCSITTYGDEFNVIGEVQYLTNYHFNFIDVEPTLGAILNHALKSKNKKFVVITFGSTTISNEYNTRLEADAAVSMTLKLGFKAKIYQEI